MLRGVESQDLNILSLIQKNQKGLVVVINKWDLIEDKTAKMMKEFEATIRSRFAPFVDFPIIFASALTKQRILKVLEEARNVYENRTTKIPTARLNEEMLPLIEAYPPPPIKVNISRSNISRSCRIHKCLHLYISPICRSM